MEEISRVPLHPVDHLSYCQWSHKVMGPGKDHTPLRTTLAPETQKKMYAGFQRSRGATLALEGQKKLWNTHQHIHRADKSKRLASPQLAIDESKENVPPGQNFSPDFIEKYNHLVSVMLLIFTQGCVLDLQHKG